MFACAVDEFRFTNVGIYSGCPSDADHQRTVDVGIALAERSNRANAVATLICVVELDRGAAHPSAVWRRRMAAADMQFRRLRVAFVSSSRIAVGVAGLVQWLTSPRPDVFRSTHTSFAEAVAWNEELAGHPMTYLFDLHREALAASVAMATDGAASGVVPVANQSPRRSGAL